MKLFIYSTIIWLKGADHAFIVKSPRMYQKWYTLGLFGINIKNSKYNFMWRYESAWLFIVQSNVTYDYRKIKDFKLRTLEFM